MTGPVVVFGAGAIGRGLIGQLVRAAGQELVLVDAHAALVEQLRRQARYQVRLTGAATQVLEVAGFRALHAGQTAAVSRAVQGAGFAATAVGAENLASLAPLLAGGVAERTEPLNILVCENVSRGDALLADALRRSGADSERARPVRCSVERMVRPEPGGVDLVGEAGQGAYVDAAAWRGPRPEVPGLEFRSEFDALYARKLYTNNAGHALLAYEGAMAGCKFIWEALAVPEIGSDLRELLGLSATALARRYGMAHGGLERHVDELVSVRYANRDLADPVARAARDPLRKLRPDERLVGLARLLESCGLPTRGVARVIAAALRYRQDQDAGSARLAHLLAERGPEGVLREVCGLGPAEAVSREILAEYRKGEQK